MKKRKGGGTHRFGSCSFKREEIEELKRATLVVSGSRTSGKVHLSETAKSYAQEPNLQLLLLPSREAVSRLNQLIEQGKRAAAIFYII